MPRLRRLLITVLALAPAAAPALLSAQERGRAADSRDLERLARIEGITNLPSPDSISPSGRTIAAGETVRGTVVARGPVVVNGRIEGSAVSLAGDVTVRRGGVVTGDAVAVGGRVIADSGIVQGEMRSMSALPTLLPTAPAAVVPQTPLQRTIANVRLVAATFAVLLVVAIGVLIFAGPNLDEVVGVLESRFGRAFWMGLVGQLLILPALLVLVAALALTIIGILLIPFAIVAYIIAVAGLVTLGFLAVARLVGGAVRGAPDASARSRALVALVVGLAGFFAVWLIAALLSWSPLAATVVRAAALAATWAAATLGLGAAIVSRAGTHRRVAAGARPSSVGLASWQTPTPLTGVAAARRSAAAAREAM